MKYLLSMIAALLLSMPLYAQQSPNINYLHFAGAPSGSCNTIMVAEDDTTGAFYDCLAGVWTSVGGGAATTPGGAPNSVQYNNGGAFGGFGTWNGSTFAIPNAASNGILFSNANGTIKGSTGATLGFSGGAITATAAGTNQNITLTPSGTGNVSIGAGALTFPGAANINAGTGNFNTVITGGTGTGSVVQLLPYPGAGHGQIQITSTLAYIDANTLNLRASASGGGAELHLTGVIDTPVNAVSCPTAGSTCTITMTTSNIVQITLTAGVTSVVLNSPRSGATYEFDWIQDGTGETVSGFPAAWHGMTAPGIVVSSYSSQSCDWTGSIGICRTANTNIP